MSEFCIINIKTERRSWSEANKYDARLISTIKNKKKQEEIIKEIITNCILPVLIKRFEIFSNDSFIVTIPVTLGRKTLTTADENCIYIASSLIATEYIATAAVPETAPRTN